jgi:hypothetical protein
MEQLASAIVGALVAGAAGATQTVVGDAYTAAKSLLAKLVPLFDSDKVALEAQDATIGELAQRLQGLTDGERAELAAEMSNLAELSGAAEAVTQLQRFTIKRIKGKEGIDMDLRAPAPHHFEDFEAPEGKIIIRTGPASN